MCQLHNILDLMFFLLPFALIPYSDDLSVYGLHLHYIFNSIKACFTYIFFRLFRVRVRLYIYYYSITLYIIGNIKNH